MTLFFTLLEELFAQIVYKLIDLHLWLLVFSGFGWSVDTDRAMIEVIEKPPALLGTRPHNPPRTDIIFLWQYFMFSQACTSLILLFILPGAFM